MTTATEEMAALRWELEQSKALVEQEEQQVEAYKNHESSEMKAYEEAMASHQVAMAAKVEECASFQQRMHHYEQHSESWEQAESRAMKHLTELNAQASELRIALISSETKANEYQTRETQLQTRLSDVKLETSQLQSELRSCRSASTGQENYIASLRTECATAEAELVQCESEMSEMHNIVTDSMESLKKLHAKDLRDRDEHVAALKYQLDLAQKRLAGGEPHVTFPDAHGSSSGTTATIETGLIGTSKMSKLDELKASVASALASHGSGPHASGSGYDPAAGTGLSSSEKPHLILKPEASGFGAFGKPSHLSPAPEAAPKPGLLRSPPSFGFTSWTLRLQSRLSRPCVTGIYEAFPWSRIRIKSEQVVERRWVELALRFRVVRNPCSSIQRSLKEFKDLREFAEFVEFVEFVEFGVPMPETYRSDVLMRVLV